MIFFVKFLSEHLRSNVIVLLLYLWPHTEHLSNEMTEHLSNEIIIISVLKCLKRLSIIKKSKWVIQLTL